MSFWTGLTYIGPLYTRAYNFLFRKLSFISPNRPIWMNYLAKQYFVDSFLEENRKAWQNNHQHTHTN